MIENISELFSNSKIVNSIRKRRKINDIQPSESSLEEAKAKVQRILKDGRKKRKKRKAKSDE